MTIKVFDDVLSKDLLEFINKEISIMQWQLHNSTPDTPTNFFNCITSSYLSHQFLFDLFIKKYSLSNKLLRSYVNCYPPGSEGSVHFDDGDFTFLFFPDSWYNKYKGRLLFEEDEIDYKENRLVIFNTELGHKAEINKSNKMRHSIAWKTLK